MPCWIDTGRDSIIALEIDLRDLSIVHNDCAATGGASMKEHIVSLIVLIAVTVDALPLGIVAGNLIVENLCFFKRSDVALGYFHIVVDDIRRLYEAVGNVFVDRFLGYIDFKCLERQPLALFLSPHLYLHALSFRGIEHSVPFRLRNLHLHAIAIGLLFAIGRADTCHAFFVFLDREHKVERRNVAGHRDITIVRHDGRQPLGIFGRRRHVGVIHTRRQKQYSSC